MPKASSRIYSIRRSKSYSKRLSQKISRKGVNNITFRAQVEACYGHFTKTDHKVICSAFLGDERKVLRKRKKPNGSTSKHDMAELNKNCNGADNEVDYTKTSKQIKESEFNKRQISQKQSTSNISTLNISPKRIIQSTSSPSNQHVLLAASLCGADVDSKQNFKKSNSSKSKNIFKINELYCFCRKPDDGGMYIYCEGCSLGCIQNMLLRITFQL